MHVPSKFQSFGLLKSANYTITNGLEPLQPFRRTMASEDERGCGAHAEEELCAAPTHLGFAPWKNATAARGRVPRACR